jgi:hypothetical protein
MTWTTDIEPIAGTRGWQCRLARDGKVVTYVEVIDRWRTDAEFVDLFVGVLAGSPFRALYFETPPLSRRKLGRLFEFVLIDSPSLARLSPEPWVFQDHFRSPGVRDDIAVFPNLGHDAVLVVPCPADPPDDYAHLTAFVRNAPLELQHALWRHVGEAARDWLKDDKPVWISTSGDGVAWLHVRLDRFPKYYNHGPYRAWDTK